MPTTTVRHATYAELTAGLKTLLETLSLFQAVEVLPATSFAQVVTYVSSLLKCPACVIVAGPAEYTGGSRQRVRESDITLLVVGEFSAALDAGAAAAYALVDATAAAFLPDADGEGPVTVEGVIFNPVSIQPIDVGENRTAFAVRVRGRDAMQDRAVAEEEEEGT